MADTKKKLPLSEQEGGKEYSRGIRPLNKTEDRPKLVPNGSDKELVRDKTPRTKLPPSGEDHVGKRPLVGDDKNEYIPEIRKKRKQAEVQKAMYGKC